MLSNGENWNDLWDTAEPLKASAHSSGVEFDLSAAFNFLYQIFTTLWIAFAVLSAVFFIVLQVIKHKLKLQRQKEAEFFKSQERSDIAKRLYNSPEQSHAQDKPFSEQWKKIESMLHSSDYSNKKLAVLEADLLLKKLLLNLGFPNDTLGKMLRAISAEQFVFLEDAWRAHKIRNELAHSSLNSSVSESEIIEAMRIYERIFRHFDFI